MKKILMCAAVLAPLAAHAQWNGSQQQVGNMSYGNYSGPNGQSMNSNSQNVGNTTYTHQNYNDGQGNTVMRNCTTQKVGNQVYTNCN
ncbi:hypothetical protein RI103_34420 [Paraburkholderia sp. FT54]|uniref:hypothetical protein n=1 Tax=Paraburkholderia sp. FT54 TaxID=3074437 RepID=UPI0028775284|nr:hypothetical protein [Paraburkholderia sp. FT54]WNC94979.1 hypothetical protein RI103_34420 [Paraburkholderia sp. FT54]